jgi:hypothetical protein
MNPRQLRETIARAVYAVTGSLMSQAEASRTREGWRVWRALWVELERKPPADRMLTVCMYCERFHASTGEWAATPPGLAEMLHDPKLVQITHGVCPVCLAARLDGPPG